MQPDGEGDDECRNGADPLARERPENAEEQYQRYDTFDFQSPEIDAEEMQYRGK